MRAPRHRRRHVTGVAVRTMMMHRKRGKERKNGFLVIKRDAAGATRKKGVTHSTTARRRKFARERSCVCKVAVAPCMLLAPSFRILYSQATPLGAHSGSGGRQTPAVAGELLLSCW